MIHRQWFDPWDRRERLKAPLVILHEGLGSVSAWGMFPQSLADVTHRRVLAYDRQGYGRSPAESDGPWPADFMHREAARLARVLREEDISETVLVGHSDGATIALLYPSLAGEDDPGVLGIVSLSAHVMVEPISIAAITDLRNTVGNGLSARLARHHDDADTLFERWSEVWVSDRFRPWAIDRELSSVTCPVLAIQGTDDGYGTRLQLKRVATGVGGTVEVHELAGVDHWPHREATETVLSLITQFCGPIAS